MASNSQAEKQCVCISADCTAHPNPELTLNGTVIPVVEQTKFLGVIFDNKLTFLPHIRYLKENCVKALVKQSYSAGSPVTWGSLETRELIG